MFLAMKKGNKICLVINQVRRKKFMQCKPARSGVSSSLSWILGLAPYCKSRFTTALASVWFLLLHASNRAVSPSCVTQLMFVSPKRETLCFKKIANDITKLSWIIFYVDKILKIENMGWNSLKNYYY